MSEHVIAIEGVCKRFGRNPVLQGLNLCMPLGQTFAFLGRNGAGKTTTIRMLLGLLKPDAGQIRVLGLDPARDAMEIRRRVGYLAEDQAMFGWMRVEQIIGFMAPFYPTWDKDLARRYLQQFELPQRTRVKHLSKGQTVRLSLLLALAHRPQLVILDDPTLGLDPIMRKEFIRDVIDHLQGSRVYFLSTAERMEDSGDRRGDRVSRRVDPVLMTIATDAPPGQAVIHKLDLSSYGDGSEICEYKGRIYFLCSESLDEAPRIVVIDVSQPDAPRVAKVLESPGRFGVKPAGNAYVAEYEIKGVWLPRIEGLNGQERLELALRLTLGWGAPPMAFSDGLLVAADGGGLSTFRLTGIEGDFAKFERTGSYRRTLLEDALMRQAYRIVLDRGLAYTLDGHGLTVFDVRRPEYPRRVGHYASAGDWFGDVAPLPDGRILVGGSKLHILAPPKVD